MTRSSRPAASMTALLAVAGVALVGCARTTETVERDTQVEEPATGLEVGATFHGFWNYDSESEAVTALRSFRDAGGTWVRIDVGWETVEPDPGAYDAWALERYDAAVETAQQEGFEVLLVFQLTPGWANGSDDSTLAPWDPADFGDFALEITTRYAGRVQAVELWNEPNQDEFFRAQEPGQEAREHAAMVADAYTKIKESGPQGEDAVTVLAGGSSHVDVSWWQDLYAAGIADHTDVIAVNPYSQPADLPPTADADGTRYRLNQLAELTQLMAQEGDGGKPIWFTEFGWSDHPNYPDMADWQLGVTQEEQADYFEQTLQLVAESYPQVEQVFWYNLRDRDDVDDLHQTNFGLLERDLTPKPVLERMAQVLDGD